MTNWLKKLIKFQWFEKKDDNFQSIDKFRFNRRGEKINLSFRCLKCHTVRSCPGQNPKGLFGIYITELTNFIYLSFENGCFPEELKMAQV